MFRSIAFEPQWQKWFDTMEEAAESDVRYSCEDYIAIVEVKKVYKINRNLQEMDPETATKEQLERYNDILVARPEVDIAEEV